MLTYSWDVNEDDIYGDATGATPTLTPADLESLGLVPGTYTIALRLTDSFGAASTATSTLTIYDNRPLASFTASPNPAAPGQTINFDGSSSHHGRPDRSIVSYEWDFDYSGTFSADATGSVVWYSYPTFGTRTAALRVTDNNVPAKNDVATVVINVNQGNHAPWPRRRALPDQRGRSLNVERHRVL